MQVTVSRKCPKCGTWNGAEDHCISCNQLLNYQKQLEQEHEARETAYRLRKLDSVDVFLAKFRNSRWWAVKAIYYILYSAWFVLASLVSFFIYMVAAGPG